ncbi:MAG: hypothetical protein IJK07_06435 [Bacteroidales bacterium]|nr:hypothetical protein [Bacteroidales bacterium]
MRYSHISVAVPMLAELENIQVLIDLFRRQTFKDFSLYFCVNNPDGWADSDDPTQRQMYADNQSTLEYLRELQLSSIDFKIVVLDFSSPGRGWKGRKRGVGWARKELFAAIDADCGDDELVVSLDADTVFAETYLESVLCTMNSHPECNALCVPYYHPLSGNEQQDRAMLRYEIYMRHYLLSLLESDNLYAFTALGSAMVFPLWAYRRVGGITPLQGGEDFYLMQKFAKTGRVLLSCNEIVRPQGRPSLRVPFGTGPAIAKGLDSMDSTYPLYPAEGFRSVAETFALFPDLYEKDIETPMSDFLRQQLKTDDLWQPLRKNFKTRDLFVHACQERVDGLRILQYLKTFPLRRPEEELRFFCNNHRISLSDSFDFRISPITEINALREALFELEQSFRQRSI